MGMAAAVWAYLVGPGYTGEQIRVRSIWKLLPCERQPNIHADAGSVALCRWARH